MTESTLDLTKLYEAILIGDASAAKEIVEAAIAAAVDPQLLVTGQMIPAMDEVGRRFEAGEYFVPELLIAGRAMKGTWLSAAAASRRGVEPIGRVVIGTVKGDMHDIGKGLVASMLEGAGFEIIDLGVDVSADKFVARLETKADIVALSALLTTTMLSIKDVIAAVRKIDALNGCKIIIGGAPVTQQYADSVGADGYSSNANGAVTLARQLLSA
ncbi:MAG: cobalamin-dependent protein [Pirellulaceae bacterium]